jgi:hypothetical protein
MKPGIGNCLTNWQRGCNPCSTLRTADSGPSPRFPEKSGSPTAFPNWGLIIKLDATEAYEAVRRLGRLLLALGGGMLLLGLGALYAGPRMFTRMRRLRSQPEEMNVARVAGR